MSIKGSNGGIHLEGSKASITLKHTQISLCVSTSELRTNAWNKICEQPKKKFALMFANVNDSYFHSPILRLSRNVLFERALRQLSV